MVTDDACPLIMGQWGVHFSAAAMCHQHEASAETGIASTSITSAEATSLNRHVMFLKGYYGGRALIGCDGSHSRL
jgi:hypothetical protein